MGNDASKQAAEDATWLVERVPFDETELRRLMEFYQNENSSSWIDDKNNDSWDKILPADFGSKLLGLLCLPSTLDLTTCDKTLRRETLLPYMDACANGCGRRGSRAALATLFQLGVDNHLQSQVKCINSKDLTDAQGQEIVALVETVLDLAHRVALAAAVRKGDLDQSCIGDLSDVQFESLKKSCIQFVHNKRLKRSVDLAMEEAEIEHGWCSKMDFIEWSEATVPVMASVLPLFFQTMLFPDQQLPPTTHVFSFPKLCDESLLLGNNGIQNSMLFSIGCMNKALGGEWHRLYTSSCDGLSYNRLQDALLGYSGPTLLVIRASDSGAIFGAFTASPWKDSKDYYGSEDCILYQLHPELTVCRPSGRDVNYMFCRSSSSAQMRSSCSKTLKGIGFGGSANQSPRLYLDESFCGCYVTCQDTTFERGYLLPRTDGYSQKTFFSVDEMEVWGCGGSEQVAAALDAQTQTRAVREAYLTQARKVDKSAFVSDLRSGLIESKAFGHMEDIHGSTRFHLLNRVQGKQ